MLRDTNNLFLYGLQNKGSKHCLLVFQITMLDNIIIKEIDGQRKMLRKIPATPA